MNIVSIFQLIGIVASILCVWIAVITILRRGKAYRKIAAESRPRKWVMVVMVSGFGVFCVWFPVFMFWPCSLLAKVLLFVFGMWWVLLALSANFARLIDQFISEVYKQRNTKSIPRTSFILAYKTTLVVTAVFSYYVCSVLILQKLNLYRDFHTHELTRSLQLFGGMVVLWFCSAFIFSCTGFYFMSRRKN